MLINYLAETKPGQTWMSELDRTTGSAQCTPTPSASPDPLQLPLSLRAQTGSGIPAVASPGAASPLGQKALLLSFSSSQFYLCAGAMVALNQELLCCLMWGREVQDWCRGTLSRTVGSQGAQIPEGPSYILACVKKEQNPQASILF